MCKDAARTIGRTLESVAGLGAEVVALDSGSTDGTLEILARHGARVERVAWQGFAATKNDAADACAGEWVLHLDADESLTPTLREAVREAVARGGAGPAGYEVNRKVWWGGGFLEHAWQPEWRLRLARRGAARWEGAEPHPSLRLTGGGGAGRLRGDLRHDAFETLEEFLRKQVRYAQQGAEAYAASGRRGSVASLALSPMGAWLKQVVVKRAWRDGWRGMAAATTVAVAAAMKHAMLLERTRGTRERQ